MQKPTPLPAVIVTDHALLRWLERVYGIDMKFFRNCVASEAQALADVGACGGYVGDQWFVLDGPTLVTVLPERPREAQRGRSFRKRDERHAN